MEKLKLVFRQNGDRREIPPHDDHYLEILVDVTIKNPKGNGVSFSGELIWDEAAQFHPTADPKSIEAVIKRLCPEECCYVTFEDREIKR